MDEIHHEVIGCSENTLCPSDVNRPPRCCRLEDPIIIEYHNTTLPHPYWELNSQPPCLRAMIKPPSQGHGTLNLFYILFVIGQFTICERHLMGHT